MQNWSALTCSQQQNLLQRPALVDNTKLAATVEQILTRVQIDRDKALLELNQQFDGVALHSLSLPLSTCQQLAQSVRDDVKQAMDLAFENISRFHQAQFPQDVEVETQPGVKCSLKHSPLEAVGLYIPGGSAPLPSTVLMLGATAKVAGCQRKVLCTPPNTHGLIAPEICYAAMLCDIDEIYLVGGAQAIAAMAFGTESIMKVDKIFGPGNSFVTEAKQQVSKLADGAAIDMPAGPSEVLVIADSEANPVFVAADLLSQAEHGPDSQAVLVSDSKQLIDAVKQQVERQMLTLSRQHIARKAMTHSRYILTDNIEQSITVSNRYAPEHLIVQVTNAEQWLARIKHAGSIFLGQWSPESAGDYASGTNHVLPTYGYARNYSSLGLADFMRRFTVQQLSRTGLENIGKAIIDLANAEGLDAHSQAVALRLQAKGE